MGRTDYIVTAGVGFDLDRSSARNTIGNFETVATTLNTVATKKAAEGFAKNEAIYKKSLAEIEKDNKKADDALVSGTKKSALAAQQAIQKSFPKEISPAKAADMDPKLLKAYNKQFKVTMKGMGTAYAKFGDEAKKMGMKVVKAQKGWGTGQSVGGKRGFAGEETSAEDRKRQINLAEKMIAAEKKKLHAMTDVNAAYRKQAAEVEALENMHKDMKNLNEEVIQQEKKHGKIKSKLNKKERLAERKKREADKGVIQRQKVIGHGLQRMGKLASMSAGQISSGLKNAFVIGTAAATAFFYKMQPLAETVTEFEKTIVNANSVFNVTREELHSVSDEMVGFTMKYGVAAQEMAAGLYQLASAGLTAAESQEVLQHTMKLAMATQGDHNALAKLTVQTIMGFGMEMEDSGLLVDKFAHSIQKSLIEWEDLASSVKFAMPFFVATGQSVDELLGGLEVLTNRALEAGIAGRGLRQALAQFTKHADDNSSALAKLGVEIMDSEGNMRALHEITLDAQAAFGDVTDLEALTAMLEDMNVRGATAFALLVQNADEFDAAVKDIANSAGEATLMADIQQQSLAMQIQRVKNALLAPFLMSDAIGEANGTLNQFTLRIKELVDEFTEFFIIIGPDGVETYSQHGTALKEFVITALDEAVIIIRQLKDVFLEQGDAFGTFVWLLKAATFPLKIVLKILDFLGPSALKWFTVFKLMTALLPINTAFTLIQTIAQTAMMYAVAATDAARKGEASTMALGRKLMLEDLGMTWAAIKSKFTLAGATNMVTGANYLNAKSMMWSAAKMLIFIYAAKKLMDVLGPLGAAIASFAAIQYLGGVAALYRWWNVILPFPPAALAATVATAGAGALAIWGAYSAFQNMGASMGLGASDSTLPELKFNKERNYDLGGTFMPSYDNGGFSTEHGMAVLQKGETVIPKTQNMLGGSGVTLNFGDIHAQDGTDFAEKVAEALPIALRNANMTGGI